MKKITLTAFLCVSLFGTFYAGEKKEEPKAKETSFKTGVWAEQIIGTYRESNLGAMLFGRCKHSTDQCIIIYHQEGQAAIHVVMFTPSGNKEFDATSYDRKPYYDYELNEKGIDYIFN